MKKILQIILTILIFSLHLKTQERNWIWQNPLPTSNNYTDVYFSDRDNGWAVGAGGTIIRTTDGGSNWFVQDAGSTENLTGIDFQDPQNGWIVGDGVMIRTVDGGKNWAVYSYPNAELQGIYWTDNIHGYAFELGYNLYITDDGGKTWTTIKLPDFMSVEEIQFTSVDTGYLMCGMHGIFKTTDAGKSWKQLYSYTCDETEGLYFIDANTGWKCGLSGSICKTTDGGDNWVRSFLQTENSAFNSIRFTDKNNGVVVGTNGHLWKTTDGGDNWISKQSNVWVRNYIYPVTSCPMTLNKVFFADSLYAYAVGEGGTIIKSTDAGQTWTRQTKGSQNVFHSACMLDTLNGWIASYGGELFHTSDGWNTIENQSYNIVKDAVRGSCFKSGTDTGYVVCEGGYIYKTEDGGKTWNEQKSNTHEHFNDINFYDQTGWAVGENACIFYTSDGGSNWSSGYDLSNYSINDVFMLTDKASWAVSDSGNIHTALQWNYFTGTNLGKQYNFKGVFFWDISNGWVVGDNGVIFKTTTWGGDNWKMVESGTTDNLSKVLFIDKNTGFAVGEKGTIIKSTDAGSNWTVEQKITDKDITQIFKQNNIIWLYGKSGLIIKSTDNGSTWNLVQNNLNFDIKYMSATINNLIVIGSNFNDVYTSKDGQVWDRMPVQINYYNSSKGDGELHFFCVDFVDKNTGWAAGEKGIIIKTTDAGKNWHILNNPFKIYFKNIKFINSKFGIAAGDEQRPIKTTDGGETWQSIQEAFGPVIHIFDENRFWVGGIYDYINYTEDGGKTTIRYPIQFDYSKIQFINGKTGFAINKLKTYMFKTIDSGKTWNTFDLQYYMQNPNDFHFFDEKHGWIVGDNGTFGFTINGGETWTKESIGTTSTLFALCVPDVYNAWVFGEYGTIKKVHSDKTLDIKVDSKDKQSDDVMLYPNPTCDDINIYLLNKNLSVFDIKIINSIGNEVGQFNGDALSAQKQLTVSVKNLPSGIYYCQFNLGTKSITRKFVVVK